MSRFILTCLWALLMAGGAAAQGAGYQIRPGDRLEISVLEDPNLNRTVLVRPDGRISLPIAGTLDAAGTTPEALQATIRRRLARDFVSPPNVTVSLVGVSQLEEAAVADTFASIYVIGEVESPGRLQVELPIDILQALALARGPGPFAARKRIQVRRRTAEGEHVMLFNYDHVEDGLVPTTAISLADGDVIVVPERGLFE